MLAALHLAQLAGGGRLDHVVADVQVLHDVAVEHAHPAGGHGAHGQLLAPGHAQLAHDQHVQGRPQGARHLRAHGHAPAGQGQHDHVVPVRQVRQGGGQLPPGFDAARQREPRGGPVRSRVTHGVLLVACAS